MTNVSYNACGGPRSRNTLHRDRGQYCGEEGSDRSLEESWREVLEGSRRRVLEGSWGMVLEKGPVERP